MARRTAHLNGLLHLTSRYAGRCCSASTRSANRIGSSRALPVADMSVLGEVSSIKHLVDAERRTRRSKWRIANRHVGNAADCLRWRKVSITPVRDAQSPHRTIQTTWNFYMSFKHWHAVQGDCLGHERHCCAIDRRGAAFAELLDPSPELAND